MAAPPRCSRLRRAAASRSPLQPPPPPPPPAPLLPLLLLLASGPGSSASREPDSPCRVKTVTVSTLPVLRENDISWSGSPPAASAAAPGPSGPAAAAESRLLLFVRNELPGRIAVQDDLDNTELPFFTLGEAARGAPEPGHGLSVAKGEPRPGLVLGDGAAYIVGKGGICIVLALKLSQQPWMSTVHSGFALHRSIRVAQMQSDMSEFLVLSTTSLLEQRAEAPHLIKVMVLMIDKATARISCHCPSFMGMKPEVAEAFKGLSVSVQCSLLDKAGQPEMSGTVADISMVHWKQQWLENGTLYFHVSMSSAEQLSRATPPTLQEPSEIVEEQMHILHISVMDAGTQSHGSISSGDVHQGADAKVKSQATWSLRGEQAEGKCVMLQPSMSPSRHSSRQAAVLKKITKPAALVVGCAGSLTDVSAPALECRLAFLPRRQQLLPAGSQPIPELRLSALISLLRNGSSLEVWYLDVSAAEATQETVESLMQKFKESFRTNTPIEIGQLQPALRNTSMGRRKRRSRPR
ncbi:hypothetical protein KIL84_021982, partial [Mauremys mutica]